MAEFVAVSRSNFDATIGTDDLATTAQTVIGAVNELHTGKADITEKTDTSGITSSNGNVNYYHCAVVGNVVTVSASVTLTSAVSAFGNIISGVPKAERISACQIVNISNGTVYSCYANNTAIMASGSVTSIPASTYMINATYIKGV